MPSPILDRMRLGWLLAGLLLGVLLTLLLRDDGRSPGTGPGLTSATQQAGPADEDEDDLDDTPSRVRRVNGGTAVVLGPEEIRLAALVMETPREVSVSPAEKSYGRVVDPAPFLDAARALATAQAADTAQGAVVTALTGRLTRLRALAAEGEITVARELADLEVQLKREIDIATTRTAARSTAEGALAARWGQALAAGVRARADWFQSLAAGAVQLIEFSASSEPPDTLLVSPRTHGEDARPVQVVGAAPAVLGTTQAATYYGIANDERLRAGMHVTCRIPREEGSVTGWLVPHAALLWHDGMQWFYVEESAGVFRRHSATDGLSHPDGQMLARDLTADSRLVIKGGQALLAEEFRARIPEEDDD